MFQIQIDEYFIISFICIQLIQKYKLQFKFQQINVVVKIIIKIFMKSSITPNKIIHIGLSPKQGPRNYSKPSKITTHFNFKSPDNSKQKINNGTPNKHIHLISNLRSQLGNIKTEVTKLIEKYPNKNSLQNENANTTVKTGQNKIISSNDTVETLQMENLTTPRARTSKRFFPKSPENEEEVNRVTENLQKIKKELRQTLQRESVIINEKGKLLQMIGALQKEKKESVMKLNEVQMQYNEMAQGVKKLKKRLEKQIQENKITQQELEKVKKDRRKEQQEFVQRIQILKKQNQKLDIKISESKKVNEELKTNEKCLKQQLESSNREVRKEQEGNYQKSAQIIVLQDKITGLKEELALKKEKGNDNQKYESLKHDLKHKDRTIQNLNSDIRKLDKQVKTLSQFKHQCYALQQTLQSANAMIMMTKLQKLNLKYEKIKQFDD